MVGKAEKLAELETLKVVQQEVVVGEQRIQADLVISCVGLPPNRSEATDIGWCLTVRQVCPKQPAEAGPAGRAGPRQGEPVPTAGGRGEGIRHR